MDFEKGLGNLCYQDVTLKNNIWVGRSEFFDCAIDSHFQYPGTDKQYQPSMHDHAGFIMSDFLSDPQKYDLTNLHQMLGNPAIYGRTCVFNNIFEVCLFTLLFFLFSVFELFS